MLQQPRRQHLTADLWAKAGELEKQFASYKKKVEKSDQAKEESSQCEKKDGRRGELYERYMRIRDMKLREQLGLRMERKQAAMTAMWEQLEKSRVEMTVRFGAASRVEPVPVPVPVRTPSPSASKKFVQLKKETSDEKKGRDVTPRSTNSSSKRYGTPSQTNTPTSSQSSNTRASTLPQSPRRSHTYSPNGAKSLPRLKSPARSAAIFSDLRKENKTPVTPKPKVLTKSQSFLLEKNNARGTPKRPPQTVNVSLRFSESSAPTDTIESTDDDRTSRASATAAATTECIDDDLTALEETANTVTDTTFGPEITIEDNILPKLQEALTEMVLNQKIEEELLTMRSSSSREMLAHVEPNDENNDHDDNGNVIAPDIANYNQNTISNVNSILNPTIDDDGESSGGSSRSWCSNFETSFSRTTIDPMIDSPILSPRGSGSTSFRFIPEPTTVRVRKQWDSRSINSPRGIKRFLSFGKKNKGTEILTGDVIYTHASLNSIVMDGESDNASNAFNQMGLVSFESDSSRNETELENGDQPSIEQGASGAKCDPSEDRLSVNSQKSYRSFWPPFLFKGAESKVKS